MQQPQELDKNLVLFSPVGSTDPIRGSYDGPLLHIVRHYKPHKVYLFLTGEMNERDLKKNLYEETIKKLAPEVIVERFRYPELKNVHKFGEIDPLYKECLNNIQKENPECKIIANVSSGTGQMQSALYVFTAQSDFPIQLISVSTEAKAHNSSKTVGDDYNTEEEWKKNLDNDISIGTENRCEEVILENIKKQFATQIIKEQIKRYDYSGAHTTAKRLNKLFSAEIRILLSAGHKRLSMESKYAKKAIEELRLDYTKKMFPVTNPNEMELYEYLLTLVIRQETGNLMAFTQGFSPAFLSILESIINNKRLPEGETVRSQCCESENDTRLKDNLPDDWMQVRDRINKSKNSTPPKHLNSVLLIEYIKANKPHNLPDDLLKNMDKLRDFESKLRNQAAHSISPIMESKVKTLSGVEEGSAGIIKMLIELYEYANGKTDWDAYKKMNDAIIALLEE